ncbi:MAG: hypothetical protein AB4062_13885 [Crocosphaera sp.]
MTTAQKPLFSIPEIPLLYSAVGCIWGSFHEDEKEESPPFLNGIIKTSDDKEFTAYIKRKTWERWVRTGKINPDGGNYFRVYFRTTKAGIINKIELISVIKNTFPREIEAKGETLEDPKDLFRIRGKIQEIEEQRFSIRIERNEMAKEGIPKFQYFDLTIKGELPNEAQIEQFWEVMCIKNSKHLKLIKGRWINEELIKNWDLELEKQGTPRPPSDKKKNKKPAKKSKEKPIKPTVIESPIIMINGKQPEITVKFTERPELPEQGKKVSLQVTGENGIIVKGELNRKTLAKQVQKIDNFEDWIGAFSGPISEITSEGVVILERGSVQIFERKKKVKSSEEEPIEVSQSN